MQTETDNSSTPSRDPLVVAAGAQGGAEDSLVRSLAEEAVAIATAGDLKRGLSLALAAHDRARTLKDLGLQLVTLNACSRCHALQNNSLAAMSSAIDALALAERLGNRRERAHALCSIASTAFFLQLLDEAGPIIERAIDEAMASGDDDLEARARVVYGENLSDLGRHDEAERQFSLALAATQRLRSPGMELRILTRQANLVGKRASYHAVRGDTAAMQTHARAALERAVELRPRAEHQGGTPQVVTMLGLAARMHALLGELAKARELLGSAMHLAARSGYVSPIPPWSMKLAEIERRQGEVDAARTTLAEGLRVAENLRPSFRIAELCRALRDLEAASGNDAIARHWQQRADEEQASLEAERARIRAVLTAQDFASRTTQ
jgi:tetratricopeptide (TPR) repeat protein